MRKAIDKKELLKKVPLSDATIARIEKKGEFPKRFYFLGKAMWDDDEVSAWLEELRRTCPDTFQGNKPPVERRKYNRRTQA